MNESPEQRMKAAVREHYDRVLKFFRTKLPEPDCYDVTQDAIAEFLALDPSRITGSPHAYLIGVARNHLKRYFSRHRTTDHFDSTRMSVAGATSMSVKLNRANQLVNALRNLPVDEQIAVEQHLLERRTLEELAAMLGVSRATAVRRVAAGRRKLAEALCEWAPADDGREPDLDPAQIDEIRAAYENA